MQYIIFFVAFLLLNGCNIVSAKSIEECASFYENALSNSSIDTSLKLANYLEKEANSCLQYDEFNVWLGFAYQDAGEYEKSVEIVKKALPSAAEYKPNLLQIIAEAELRKGNEKRAVRQAEKIRKEFPHYVPILGFLGEIALKNKDMESALIYADKMYEIAPNALSLINQAAVYHQLGRDQEVVTFFNKAIELEPKRIAKTTGLIEAILSLAILNKRAAAVELAKKHIKANPSWRDNPTFLQIAEELGLAD